MCLGAGCVGNMWQMYTNRVKQRLFLLGQRRVFLFFPNFSLLFVDSRPDDLLHERALLIYLCAPTAGAGTKYSQQMMSNGRNVTIDKSSWSFLFYQGFLLSTHLMICDRSPLKDPSTSLFWSSFLAGSLRGTFQPLVSYHLQHSPFPPTAFTYQVP